MRISGLERPHRSSGCFITLAHGNLHETPAAAYLTAPSRPPGRPAALVRSPWCERFLSDSQSVTGEYRDPPIMPTVHIDLDDLDALLREPDPEEMPDVGYATGYVDGMRKMHQGIMRRGEIRDDTDATPPSR